MAARKSTRPAPDPAKALDLLTVGGRTYRYCSLRKAEKAGFPRVAELPWCLRVLLENVLRNAMSGTGDIAEAQAVHDWVIERTSKAEIRFRPQRVMMDDTAGLPLIGDFASMRDSAAEAGRDPACISFHLPVDFVVDHSIIADHAGTADALSRNSTLEYERNRERFRLLRWASSALENLRVFPPGSGIGHQINLEHLATVVSARTIGGEPWLMPDTMVGIDSHTPMVNGLGILGWGVSGMEGLAAALGEPVSFRLPEVIGVHLTGALPPGVVATDLALTLTQGLRAMGVIGRFVEYFGPGVTSLPVADRATVANMTPECGATMSCFPIDDETLDYLRVTGRSAEHVELVEAYARAQGLWHVPDGPTPEYTSVIEYDLSTVDPAVAGPSLPHERRTLTQVPAAFGELMERRAARQGRKMGIRQRRGNPPVDGDIAIAAITSCTNTSNPEAILTAALLARNAVKRGMTTPAWVKTSLSPGSRVVADYLIRSGLQPALDALGFQVAGYGCMTCVGFSGPLLPDAAEAVSMRGAALAAVLSGNRNFAGRVHADVQASFLASPPLVVAYALAGTVLRDLSRDPVGLDASGVPVFLSELWPRRREVDALIHSVLGPASYVGAYQGIIDGDARWQGIPVQPGERYAWPDGSCTISRPVVFGMSQGSTEREIRRARILALYGDQVTTEHLSPMNAIPKGSAAAEYLESLDVVERDWGTYAGRRLNAEVMVRGTFCAPQLVNRITGKGGGITRHWPDGTECAIHEAASSYREEGVPLVVVAGRQYGMGSSRDWSAKGPRLLGVRAVIAPSFERIHRANLVAAGVVPLQFIDGIDAVVLGIDGSEVIDVNGLDDIAVPRARVSCTITRKSGDATTISMIARLDTATEVRVFRRGGLLPLVFDRLVG